MNPISSQCSISTPRPVDFRSSISPRRKSSGTLAFDSSHTGSFSSPTKIQSSTWPDMLALTTPRGSIQQQGSANDCRNPSDKKCSRTASLKWWLYQSEASRRFPLDFASFQTGPWWESNACLLYTHGLGGRLLTADTSPFQHFHFQRATCCSFSCLALCRAFVGAYAVLYSGILTPLRCPKMTSWALGIGSDFKSLIS